VESGGGCMELELFSLRNEEGMQEEDTQNLHMDFQHRRVSQPSAVGWA